MYEIKLDLFLEHEMNGFDENPVFVCEDWNEFIEMIMFFFKNGYDVYIREVETGD